MPAVSIAQQNFFKLVNAYKKGGLSKSEVSKQVVDTAKSLTKKDIEDYLKVKKNAPDKVQSNNSTPSDNTDYTDIPYYDITEEDITNFSNYISRTMYKERIYMKM